MNLNKKFRDEQISVFNVFSKLSRKNSIDHSGYVVTYVLQLTNVEDAEVPTTRVKFGFSVKNPNDVHIPRIAKTIAYRRFIKKPLEFFVETEILNNTSVLTGLFKVTLDNIDTLYIGHKKNKVAEALKQLVYNQFIISKQQFEAFLTEHAAEKNAEI